ncbi:MAG: HIT family protein [Sphaerochaetaceae bacterium]|jgi:diadenosine tetraphosphate (Ap4A) HIT family hydrolase|nr:HIT family protein [Sphaerochaetaceae bacterium]NLO61533.1 HIT family protein [Spirochaetales bacterium]
MKQKVDGCMYCDQKEAVSKLMILVARLRTANLYLLRDQSFTGRCVLALRDHCTEADELEPQQGSDFFRDLQDAVAAIRSVWSPAKINYAIYGDFVPHFHIHLVPKYEDGPLWGKAFSAESVPPVYLTEEEYESISRKLLSALDSNVKR